MSALNLFLCLSCLALLAVIGAAPLTVKSSDPSPNSQNATTPSVTSEVCGIRLSHGANRIVGGSVVAIPHSWPWFAALFFDVYHLCGATLISSQWAVTAAHCFFIQGQDLSRVPTRFRLKLGAHVLGDGGFANEPTQQIVPGKRIFIHPKYNRADPAAGNDIALVKLAYKVNLNENVAPICVAKEADAKAGDSVVAIGYGTTKEGGNTSATLRQVGLKIVLQKECQEVYDTIDFSVAEDAICADGKIAQKPSGVCNGDSGGPLMKQDAIGLYTLLGVVSWSYGCALSPYPGVYTQITTPVLKWIQDTSSGL